jgi:hypothetical protein
LLNEKILRAFAMSCKSFAYKSSEVKIKHNIILLVDQ